MKPFLSQGIPPSPVGGVVRIDGVLTPFLIGGTDADGALADADHPEGEAEPEADLPLRAGRRLSRPAAKAGAGGPRRRRRGDAVRYSRTGI